MTRNLTRSGVERAQSARAPSVETILFALADPTRRRTVELLQNGPLRAGELASALDTTKPALTRHLRVLRESGLVEERSLARDARVHVYSLPREPFAELRAWLDEIESHWALQLDSFKHHAERTRGQPKKSRRSE